MPIRTRDDLRNVAIVAHVDHLARRIDHDPEGRLGGQRPPLHRIDDPGGGGEMREIDPGSACALTVHRLPSTQRDSPETLRHWVRQAEIDRGTRAGTTRGLQRGGGLVGLAERLLAFVAADAADSYIAFVRGRPDVHASLRGWESNALSRQVGTWLLPGSPPATADPTAGVAS